MSFNPVLFQIPTSSSVYMLPCLIYIFTLFVEVRVMTRKFSYCYFLLSISVLFSSVTDSWSESSSEGSRPRRKKYSKRLPKAYQRYSKPKSRVSTVFFALLRVLYSFSFCHTVFNIFINVKTFCLICCDVCL